MDSSEVIHATQVGLPTVTSEAVARETRGNSIIAMAYESVVKGLSARIDEISHTTSGAMN